MLAVQWLRHDFGWLREGCSKPDLARIGGKSKSCVVEGQFCGSGLI
jgi:hypothetical protein